VITHHILPKNGPEKFRDELRECQQILLDMGIDPFFGKENLVAAPNVGHTDDYYRYVIAEVKKNSGKGPKNMLATLKRIGREYVENGVKTKLGK
jgi:hypothetical protein